MARPFAKPKSPVYLALEKMKSAAQISYIRQLCCLGLGGQIIMPELLRALHDFIPSSFNIFVWMDENHQVSNLYSENNEAYAAPHLHLNELLSTTAMPSQLTTFSEAKSPLSASFDLTPKSLKAGHCVKATVQDDGRGLGSIVLNRVPGDKPFSDGERISLHSVMPYFAHGLRGTRDVRGELTPSGESGTLIVDSQDQIIQHCDEGKRLLMLATHAAFTGSDGPSLASPMLKLVCANLRCALQRPSKHVPTEYLRNAWGEFAFRAYALSTDGEPNGSIALVIERYEPMPLALMRAMRTLPITAREREVCLLLSYGHTHSMIGERMRVSKHTATDYVRRIYHKLDVRSQDQLMKKLLSDPTPEAENTRGH